MKTKAAVLREAGPDRWWEIDELELAEPKAGEVLVRLRAAGLCHSDDHIRNGDIPGRLPMVGGHEGEGVVEAVGSEVTRVAEGDRVVCSFIPACGKCRYCSTGRQNLCDLGANAMVGCLPDGTFRFRSGDDEFGGMCALGTFSEYAVLSEGSVVPYQADVAPELAALVSCGVTTGWGSAVYAAGVRAGETVVIFGIGGVGINAVQGARYAGAKNVIAIDPVPFKLEMAKVLGATHTFTDPAAARELIVDLTRGQLAEHAILTVGVMTTDVVLRAAEMVGKDGQVTITGVGNYELGVPGSLVAMYQRRFHGVCFGSANPLYDIPRLIGLYQSGDLKLDELVTKRYRLDEVNQGYRDMLDGKNIRGVVIHDQS
ncbi:MAG: NDMA-dependent alcohol dehydrogenase [Pseudonocardiaceae bacterium]|nr:NDMA-dependent alcohol dehydrogenase [Pseudonocardiaceae bacterium]